MKHLSKLFGILFVLFAGICFFPSVTKAEILTGTVIEDTDYPDDSLFWQLDDGGMLTIGVNNSSDAKYDLTEADWSVGKDEVLKDSMADITTITIGKGVESVSGKVFGGCNTVTELRCTGSDLVRLGDPEEETSTGSVFYNCTSVETIRLSSSITAIAEDVFEDCSGLKDVYFSGDHETLAALAEDYTDGHAFLESETCVWHTSDSVSAIGLNYGTATISVKRSFILQAVFTPSLVWNRNVNFTIESGDDVVSITPNGYQCTVTGLKAGTAVIRATTADKAASKAYEECTVTVNENPFVEELTVSPLNISLDVNESTTITYSYKLSNEATTGGMVSWTVSDGSVISFDKSTGEVTGLRGGTATLTLKVRTETDTIGKSQVIHVTVAGGVQTVESVTFSKESLTIEVGNTAHAGMTYLLSDGLTTGASESWFNKNMSIIDFDPHTQEITAKKKGTAVLEVTVTTPTDSTGKTASITIVVTGDPITVKSVSMGSESSVTIAVEKGYVIPFSYELSDGSTTGADLEWTNTNSSVLHFEKDMHKVVGIKSGEGQIKLKVTTEDDSVGKTAVLDVKVINDSEDESTVLSLSANQTSLTLKKGASATVKATWTLSSDDPNVSAVWGFEDNGVISMGRSSRVGDTISTTITGLKAGTTSIQAKVTTPYDVVGKTVTIPVTVTADEAIYVSSVTLEPATMVMHPGDTLPYTLSYKLSNGATTGGSVVWTNYSDDIVSLDESKGTVKALKKGVANIRATVKTADDTTGKSQLLIVTVRDAGESLEDVTVVDASIEPTEASIEVGTSVQLLLSYLLSDSEATGALVEWSSSDTSIATVSNGLVTGVKEGDVKIFASVTTPDDSVGKKASASVSVKPEGSLVPDDDDADGVRITGVVNKTYDNGNELTQDGISVYYDRRLLSPEIDYTVSYDNNWNAGIATMYIDFKGQYYGQEIVNFTILPIDISSTNKDVLIEPLNIAYGESLDIEPVVWHKDLLLMENTDFTYRVKDSAGNILSVLTQPGTYTVTFTGRGNFTGTRTANLTAVGANELLLENASVTEIATQKYSKQGVTLTSGRDFQVTYYDNGTSKNVASTSYKVSYINNDRSGTAVLVLTGTGVKDPLFGKPFVGEKHVSFTIEGTSLRSATTTAGWKSSIPYTGEPITQAKSGILSVNGVSLKEGVDYTVSYENNVNAGTAKAIFTGMGAYSDYAEKTFNISKIAITSAAVNASTSSSVVYVKGGATPEIKLVFAGRILTQDTDFNVKYSDNNNIGKATATVTGINNFTGTRSLSFSVRKGQLSVLKGSVDSVKAGSKKWKSKPVIYDSNGKKLQEGKDYKLTYNRHSSGKTESGEDITVVAIGEGKYSGRLTMNYTAAKKLKKISKAKVLYIGNESKLAAGHGVPDIKESDLLVTVGSTELGYLGDYKVMKVVVKKNKLIVTIHGEGIYTGSKTFKLKLQTN